MNCQYSESLHVLGCGCKNITVIVKNNASIYQYSREGSYEVSEKINGEPTWVSNSNAIWYSRSENVWYIGALSDIGERTRGIVAYEKRGFSCPYEATIDVIEFYNSQTNTYEPNINNDITIQCTTPLQGDKIKIFPSNVQNFDPKKINGVHCISTYLSNYFVPEDDLSSIDSQDAPDEGSDQTLKILYESYEHGNYIDFTNSHNGELILGSKNGEIFTYLPNREETEKLNSDTVAVYSLSDDPQNTVHIEFLSKYFKMLLAFNLIIIIGVLCL